MTVRNALEVFSMPCAGSVGSGNPLARITVADFVTPDLQRELLMAPPDRQMTCRRVVPRMRGLVLVLLFTKNDVYYSAQIEP